MAAAYTAHRRGYASKYSSNYGTCFFSLRRILQELPDLLSRLDSSSFCLLPLDRSDGTEAELNPQAQRPRRGASTP
jgi:hypothetical protein